MKRGERKFLAKIIKNRLRRANFSAEKLQFLFHFITPNNYQSLTQFRKFRQLSNHGLLPVTLGSCAALRGCIKMRIAAHFGTRMEHPSETSVIFMAPYCNVRGPIYSRLTTTYVLTSHRIEVMKFKSVLELNPS